MALFQLVFLNVPLAAAAMVDIIGVYDQMVPGKTAARLKRISAT